jgi:hypothetical protein
MSEPRIFGREPALFISAIAALLALAGGFGLPGADDGLVAAVTAFLTAAAAAWTAWRVDPVAPSIFGGVITTGATLVAAFGLDLTQTQVALVSAAAMTLVTLFAVRPQVTPVDSPAPIPAVPAAPR